MLPSDKAKEEADSKDINATPAVGSTSISGSLDFKFNFGYTPSQEPSRKLAKPHGHVTRTDEKSIKPAEPVANEEKPKENTFAFAFSLPGFETQDSGAKSIFKFPSVNVNLTKPDGGAQSTSTAEGSTSLVTRPNHTTMAHIEKKDYQNKDSLFEGGDVELYHYITTENKWVTQNRGYLQIIKVEDSPDERQLVFSRIGTSVIAINARIHKDTEFTQDGKRYLKVPLYNSVTKAALVVLFKFVEEKLRDACYKAMYEQEKEEKEKEEKPVAEAE